MAKYTITYDRDESDAWIAQVRGVPEAHSYGRTIEQARERVREALSLWRTNAETAELVDKVHLPAQASGLVNAFIQARKRADSGTGAVTEIGSRCRPGVDRTVELQP